MKEFQLPKTLLAAQKENKLKLLSAPSSSGVASVCEMNSYSFDILDGSTSDPDQYIQLQGGASHLESQYE